MLGRPRKIKVLSQPIVEIPVEIPMEDLTVELTSILIASNLCVGCGQLLNEPQITNDKGSYHGVACYNKIN